MIRAWIEAMRLRTLPVSVAGVVCGCSFCLADGVFCALPAALCLTFALLCQIASNFANEYYDFRAGRDRVGREGPRRGVTEGDITPKAMKCAIYVTLALAAVVGLSLTCFGGLWLILVGVCIGLGVLAYSTGPYPLSTHCLGEVAVVLFFGLVPVAFTYYVQALTVTTEVILGGLAIGLMGANVLIVNNTRDIPDDRAVSKRTLASVFGIKAMVSLYLFNAVMGVVLTLHSWRGLYFIVPAVYIIASTAIAVALMRRKGAAMTPLLGMTSVLMFVYALMMLIVAI